MFVLLALFSFFIYYLVWTVTFLFLSLSVSYIVSYRGLALRFVCLQMRFSHSILLLLLFHDLAETNFFLFYVDNNTTIHTISINNEYIMLRYQVPGEIVGTNKDSYIMLEKLPSEYVFHPSCCFLIVIVAA